MIKKLLIANRGEVAVRIARAAADLAIETVAVYTRDDAYSLHVKFADESCLLNGSGATAYLDIEQLLQVAKETGCDAVHPGYGFLSEREDFSRGCELSDLIFVGPSPGILGLIGDKSQGRKLAVECGVPVVPGSAGLKHAAEAEAFFRELGEDATVMVKATAGGGGRGMRLVRPADSLKAAFEMCRREAESSFGNGELYIEQCIYPARHIEVQIIGDGADITHLWERECTLQRQNQKTMEVAPSPSLSPSLREAVIEAAVRMAKAVGYRSLGTFEFLVDDESGRYYFIEVNPRLQVEHTVTEQVTGIDLVQAQLRIAGGASLSSLKLLQNDILVPAGFAVQLRLNMETMSDDGTAHPTGGTLSKFELPNGPGIRVDTFGYSGYTANPRYDSLLAKLVVHGRSLSFEQTLDLAYRALCQCRIEGIETNASFLKNLLKHPMVIENRVYTRFIDDYAKALLVQTHAHPNLYFDTYHPPHEERHVADEALEGMVSVPASMSGIVVKVCVVKGQFVQKGEELAIIEAMKMEHAITAPCSGVINGVFLEESGATSSSERLFLIEPREEPDSECLEAESVDLDAIRMDLSEVLKRHAKTEDQARPDAVGKRHRVGKRTARENVADLIDPDTFIEFGALTFAAQRSRYTEEQLVSSTPADGLIAGMGKVRTAMNATSDHYCMAFAYDYTVLAGTQGIMNHKKLTRTLRRVEELGIPLVLFAEGGGGRPSDTDDGTRATGLDMPSFVQYARLSGLVPRICIASGRCFAGNAVLAGCSDIIIATEDANIGMAGPVMIEGAGLGSFPASAIGPVSTQHPNGVIDCLADDEAGAVEIAKQLLSFFSGTVASWEEEDQRWLRRAVPNNRLRSYDVAEVISVLADAESCIELRSQFAPNMMTAFVRIEGKPVGLVANNPLYLGGAIDADAADKAARFIQMCDAFDLPVLTLCDTPGFMVGPNAEESAQVRHAGRLFVTVANVTTPFISIILRKGYGLGAMAMTGGSFHEPLFTASWPTGEFGGMGPEGAVRLAHKELLENANNAEERSALFDKLVGEYVERGTAINVAASLEFDAVIDPADSRRWIAHTLSAIKPSPSTGKKRPFIDTW